MKTLWTERFGVILIGLIALALFSATLYGVAYPEILEWLFINTSYYIFTAMLVTWALCMVRLLGQNDFRPIACLAKNGPYFLTAVMLTSVVFLSIPVAFRTLNDEAVLMSVSQSLLYFRTPHEIINGLYYWDSFTPLTTAVPIRPLLFPFVLQLIHQFFGFHYQNAFVLNAVILFIFISAVGIWFQRVSDKLTSYAAMFLCAVHPVVLIYGTGGGYDLMATVLLLTALALLFNFLKERQSKDFAFLWMTLILLANVRHESCIYSFIIGLTALVHCRKEDLKTQGILLGCSIIYVMPYVWQRMLVIGRYENPADTPLFSLEKLFEHSYELIANFINFDFFLPFSGFLNVIAVVIYSYLAIQILRKKIRINKFVGVFAFVVLVCLAINLLIVLSHHAGNYAHPAQARFFIIFALSTALSPIVLKVSCPDKIRSKHLLCLSIILLFIHHPVSMKKSFLSVLMENRSYQAGQKYLSKHGYDNPLIITKWPVQYTIRGYSAMNFEYAEQHRNRIRSDFSHYFFDDIILLQQKSIESGQALEGQSLNWDDEFKIMDKVAIFYDKIYLQLSTIEFLQEEEF